ncbi:F-box domain-containing protein [Mycena sanguinolenta]|uniref:F-box domain-containing protein n=1 Tax=Mycena sanguinolenta TaxID=230812 RepID=A0A8H6YSQ9_9AGAR|nr:F-box domain-containing protein [Mycena sanguinolenta]
MLPTIALSSFSLGPFTNHPPQYQNQYMLVNDNGWLRIAAVNRRVLALPPELLAEIFYFCLPFHDERPHIPDPNDAPLVLCAVCRQWRNVALNTPWLWSSICFDLGRLADWPEIDSEDWDSDDSEWEYWDSGELYTDMCWDWLSRAQSIPLSISFDDSVPEGHPLLELVCEFTHQCRDIKLPENLPRLPLPVDGKYPLLEKLRISSPPSYQPALSFHDAPKLHDVYIPTYTTKIQLPWHQLTRFWTHDIDIKDCLQLLRHASNLVDAHLRIPTYRSSVLPNTIFALPQLKYLNLSGARDGDSLVDGGVKFMTLLRCLQAPALETLALGSSAAQRSETFLQNVSPFLSFLSRSSLELHTWKLFLVPTTANDLIACLKTAPSVVHLELRISDRIVNTNPVFAQFTGYRDFLPNLQRLQIAFPNSSTVAKSLVISMLIWRCMTEGVTRLQSCRFVVNNNYTTELPSYLKPIKTHPVFLELEASGMELYLGPP